MGIYLNPGNKGFCLMDCGRISRRCLAVVESRSIVNTRSFQNDMRNFGVKDDVLTLLIHLGYLAYDAAAEETFIPNKEIIMELKKVWSGAENSIASKSKVSNPKPRQRRHDLENHFDH